jgi:cytidine deaminase
MSRDLIELISEDQRKELLVEARKALSLAYSPYSEVKVGAALIGSSGRIYSGGNIGNTCSTLNCCAEQAAIIQAVLAKDYPLKALAIVQNSEQICPPCGRCLQLLAEFATEMVIITTSKVWLLSYMLPVPFKRTESRFS